MGSWGRGLKASPGSLGWWGWGERCLYIGTWALAVIFFLKKERLLRFLAIEATTRAGAGWIRGERIMEL